MAKVVWFAVAVKLARLDVPFTAEPVSANELPFQTNILSEVVLKYKVPVSLLPSVFPLLSVDGTEDLAPRYLSSNEAKEVAAFVSDVAALLALVEAADAEVAASPAFVVAMPAWVVAVDAEVDALPSEVDALLALVLASPAFVVAVVA